MTDDHNAIIIREAEGYAESGMYQEAWDRIDDLPPSARLWLDAIALRLLICARLSKWTIGSELVKLVDLPLPLKVREAGGRYLLALSNCVCAFRLHDEAKEALSHAMRIWPEGGDEGLKSAIMRGDCP